MVETIAFLATAHLKCYRERLYIILESTQGVSTVVVKEMIVSCLLQMGKNKRREKGGNCRGKANP